jgi:hypothetical protein
MQVLDFHDFVSFIGSKNPLQTPKAFFLDDLARPLVSRCLINIFVIFKREVPDLPLLITFLRRISSYEINTSS